MEITNRLKYLEEIMSIREQKGNEQKALEMIEELEKDARKNEDREVEAKVNWEKAHVWQHKVMNGEEVEKAKAKMGEAAYTAHEIIEKYEIEKLLATSYRFLGRTHTYQGEHEKAKEMYEKAIELVEQKENKEQLLELRGFLAATILMLDDSDIGVNLAIQTYNDFEDSPEGKALKENDYYVWAIWKSGTIFRMIFAGKERGSKLDKERWNGLLDECEKFLKIPEGDTTWGDKDFSYRLDELKKAREILSAQEACC